MEHHARRTVNTTSSRKPRQRLAGIQVDMPHVGPMWAHMGRCSYFAVFSLS